VRSRLTALCPARGNDGSHDAARSSPPQQFCATADNAGRSGGNPPAVDGRGGAVDAVGVRSRWRSSDGWARRRGGAAHCRCRPRCAPAGRHNVRRRFLSVEGSAVDNSSRGTSGPSALIATCSCGCVDECFDCAATCTSCADGCLGEPVVPALVRGVRLNLHCADACDTTGRVVTHRTEPALGVVCAAIEACIVICRACGDECERHAAHHDQCRVCAGVCRRCEQACSDPLASIG